MAKIYARLCEKGEKNFFDVPKKLQNQAREIIESDGFAINDDGTVVPANKNTTHVSSSEPSEIFKGSEEKRQGF